MKKKAYADGDIERAKQRYTDPDIEWDDKPWGEGNLPVPNSYDLIVLDHLLQTGPINQARRVVEYYLDMLKDGGKIIVIVPSLEWAATEIATKDVFPYSAYASLYGVPGQETFTSGYTLNGLRSIIENTDVELVSVITEPYILHINEQVEMPRQNVVIATRKIHYASEAIA